MVGALHRAEQSGKNQYWTVFRLAVAVILIVAAITKAWNSPRILAMDGLLSDHWLLNAVIGLEALMAVLILCLSANIARVLIIVVFGCFAVVAGYALILGKDCNCFGLDLLGAWFTLPLDLIVLVGAWFLVPSGESQPLGRIPTRFVALAIVLAVVGIGVSQYRISKSKTTERLEFLLAAEMVEKPWPITSTYHPELAQLATGKWFVLIVRSDCKHCQELIEERFQDPKLHRPSERTAVFIAGNDAWSFQLDHVSLEHGQSSIIWPNGEPFVASPAVFQCVNGIIKRADDSVDHLTFESIWTSRD